MRFTFGDQMLEVRAWTEGKALLITKDSSVKRRILTAMDEAPDAFELLADPDEPALEDFEGALPVIVDREKVGLFVNLENMQLGVCVSEEVAEDEDEAGEADPGR